MNKKKLVIVDGHSLAYRAFFALPLLQTSSGLTTNAAFGFTRMLSKLIKDVKPDYIAVAFDKGKTTFRTEKYAAYKGHRQKMPVELREQISYIEDILAAYHIKQISLDGFEADDIIGTLSLLADETGEIETTIVTGDRDAYQLISERTNVMITKKGITDVRIMDVQAIHEQYGLTPAQLIDVKALMGDKSDNIPGIPKVGEKTALKLIQQFGSLETVYQNIDQVSGNALPKRLVEHEEIARLSQDLATIRRNLPIDLCLEEFAVHEPDKALLWELFSKLEFKKMLEELNYQPGTALAVKEGHYRRVASERELSELLGEVRSNGKCTLVFTMDTDDAKIAKITGMAISPEPDTAYYFDEMKAAWWEQLGEMLADSNIKKCTHRVKLAYIVCNARNIELIGVSFDTALAAYLLQPSYASYTLPELVEQYADKGIATTEDETDPMLTLCREADLLWQLEEVLSSELETRNLTYLYEEVEVPLAIVLAKMELCGIGVNRTILEAMEANLEERLQTIESQIYDIAGEKFNASSPKQLGHILFEKLGLPVIKKTKTGYSTAHDVLEELAKQHELPRLIIGHRTLAKLKSTYVDGLLSLLADGSERIHTTFNQTITTTGRLSSQDPNLQNIPIRLDEGRRIRKAFVPSRGYDYILAADYSQIELRILAHMSQDEILMQAFRDKQDIHTRTAAEVFGVSMADVDKEMRRRAKAVNFGIVYGISDYGLARDLNITRKEAGEYISSYFARYPRVKEYVDNAIAKARTDGYVETLLHRRRYLPEINSRNFNRRSFAERTAMNTPIQGSAADLIKLAMVRMQRELEKGGYATNMMLQVHDELIFEVPHNELSVMKTLVPHIMQEAMTLTVPIVVDVKMGNNWYDMEEI